jgi:hypothetical protein
LERTRQYTAIAVIRPGIDLKADYRAEAAEPTNVDTVIVDGRILKRAGQFTSLLPGEIIRRASASLKGVSER